MLLFPTIPQFGCEYKPHRMQIYLLFYLVVASNATPFIRNANEDYSKFSGGARIRKAAIECLFHVVNAHFLNNSLIIVSLSTSNTTSQSPVFTDRLMLDGLHHQLRWSVEVNKAASAEKVIRIPFWKKTDNYILQVKSVGEFERNLQQLVQLPSWNPHARFLVFFNNLVENSSAVVTHFMRQLSKRQVFNALIMVHDVDPLVLRFFTWFPYTLGHCDNQDAKEVATCTNGNLTEDIHVFGDKIPKDLHGCKITVQTHVWPPYVLPPSNSEPINKGLEVLMLREIASVMNFTILYKSDEGNNTLEYVLQELLNGNSQIGIGSIAPDIERHLHLDHSQPYLDESIAWIVPSAIEVPRWKNITLLFNSSTWLGVLMAYFLCASLLWTVARTNLREPGTYRTISGSFLNLLSIWLGMAVALQPRTKLPRMLIMAWILFSINTNTAYQTSLISVLTQPSYEAQIRSKSELFESQLNFGIINANQRFFQNDSIYESLLKYARNCDDIRECLNDVAYKRNLAVAAPRLYMKFRQKMLLDKYGHSLIYALKEDIVNFPIEMLMIKGFPLLEKINYGILIIKESGMLQKWKLDYIKMGEQISSDEQPTDSSSFLQTGLTLLHMQGAFVSLGLGLTLAVIAFLFEIFTENRKRKKHLSGIHHQKHIVFNIQKMYT